MLLINYDLNLKIVLIVLIMDFLLDYCAHILSFIVLHTFIGFYLFDSDVRELK